MARIRTALLFSLLLLPGVAGGVPGAAAALGGPGGQAPGTTQSGLVSPPPWSFNDVACAPFLTVTRPDARFQVSGTMDTFVKRMMGSPDILVINGGLQQGLQVGQEFFVRRLTRHMGERGPDRDHPVAVHTAGWIRLIGVGPTSSTASITHACGDGILISDYLEPFVPPLVGARETEGTPQFEHLGHVMMADAGRTTVGIGEFTTIDRGSDHGIMSGQRFTVYRDVGRQPSSMYRDPRGPSGLLVEIGTVIATSVRPDNSTVQVLQARDAIRRDDFVAVRR
jgi:hypothetical protein